VHSFWGFGAAMGDEPVQVVANDGGDGGFGEGVVGLGSNSY